MEGTDKETRSVIPGLPYTREEIQAMDNQTLHQLYHETGNEELKWCLVMRYTELVRRIAAQTTGLFYNFTQLDDVIHEGLLVLLRAVEKFDPEKNVKFEAYVAKRLRGMVVDLARKQDWVPRMVRRDHNRVRSAREELFTTLGRTPTDQEMAEYLHVDVEEYERLLSETAVSNLVSFEAALDTYGDLEGEGTHYLSPEENYQRKEMRQVLQEGISTLRENEQLVLSLYYQKELTMKEIAQVMGVSAPRVSQIHNRALGRLQTYMKQYLDS